MLKVAQTISERTLYSTVMSTSHQEYCDTHRSHQAATSGVISYITVKYYSELIVTCIELPNDFKICSNYLHYRSCYLEALCCYHTVMFIFGTPM